MTSSQGLNRGRYLRLMALSSTEILGTIPLGTYLIVLNSNGVTPYGSWASVHSDYSKVNEFPSAIWKKNSTLVIDLEMFRWSLVACAFVFFAFFGFADDARQHYRLVYMWLARRLGYPTSSLRGSSRVYVVRSLWFIFPDVLSVFWQYSACPSHEHLEQGGRYCSCSPNEWREQIE